MAAKVMTEKKLAAAIREWYDQEGTGIELRCRRKNSKDFQRYGKWYICNPHEDHFISDVPSLEALAKKLGVEP